MLDLFSKIFSGLANTDTIAAKEEFCNKAPEFIDNLNEIRHELKESFAKLNNHGVLSVAGKQIPYTANLNYQERKFERKAKTVTLLRKQLENLL